MAGSWLGRTPRVWTRRSGVCNTGPRRAWDSRPGRDGRASRGSGPSRPGSHERPQANPSAKRTAAGQTAEHSRPAAGAPQPAPARAQGRGQHASGARSGPNAGAAVAKHLGTQDFSRAQPARAHSSPATRSAARARQMQHWVSPRPAKGSAQPSVPSQPRHGSNRRKTGSAQRQESRAPRQAKSARWSPTPTPTHWRQRKVSGRPKREGYLQRPTGQRTSTRTLQAADKDRVLARIEDQPRRATFSRTLSRQLTERPKKEGGMRQGRLHWRSATRGRGSSGDQPEKETPKWTHLRQSQDQHKKGKSSAARTCPPPRRFTPTMRPTKFSKRIGQESCLTWTLG